MDDGSKCMKYLIFAVNLIFVLAGLALVGLGGALLVKWDTALDLVRDMSPISIYMLILLGLVTFCIAFLGCCGAIQESPCMLVSFAIILSLIVAVKMVLGVLILSRIDLVKGFAEGRMTEIFKENIIINEHSLTREIETRLQCCGLIHEDKGTTIASTTIGANSPSACQYRSGCLEQMNKKIEMARQPFGYGAIGIAILEGLGIILVAMLVCSIRSSRYKYNC